MGKIIVLVCRRNIRKDRVRRDQAQRRGEGPGENSLEPADPPALPGLHAHAAGHRRPHRQLEGQKAHQPHAEQPQRQRRGHRSPGNIHDDFDGAGEDQQPQHSHSARRAQGRAQNQRRQGQQRRLPQQQLPELHPGCADAPQPHHPADVALKLHQIDRRHGQQGNDQNQPYVEGIVVRAEKTAAHRDIDADPIPQAVCLEGSLHQFLHTGQRRIKI